MNKIILQINVVCNTGSTGHIAEEIGCFVINSGFQSYIAYGRGVRPSSSYTIRIGSDFNLYTHAVQSRFFDNQGLASVSATRGFIAEVKSIKPDIIHLHNIHGYYLNYPILFDSLKEIDIPVVWTLHDCWSFTGHCAHFEQIGCDRWKTGCFSCPNKRDYPASFLFDNSKRNYALKKSSFNGINNMTIVPVSDWLDNHLKNSFLYNYPRKRIYNGVDLSIFKPISNNLRTAFRILGVSGVWNESKGLCDFYRLREVLDKSIEIILVGLSEKQIKRLPKGILGIQRTESVHELAKLYSSADVFINPTYGDTFPTVNLESLACGTPVITYNTGGSPEAVTPETGFVVEPGHIQGLVDCINIIKEKGKDHYMNACRERAVKHFNKDDRYQEYIDLYKSLLNKK